MTRGSQTGWFGIFALVLVVLLGVMGFVSAPQAEAFVPYMVNTVVDFGPGHSPQAGVFDNNGKVYVSDNGDHTIKVIDRYTGAISNLAGTGTPGYSGDGGDASLAMLNNPNDLYLDWKSNSLYFADTGNEAIRKIDLNQTPPQISTVAGGNGTGNLGDGGPAINAQLASPFSIAMDSEGNLYIADYLNNKVRIINTTGYINTYAGTGAAGFGGDLGPASSAMFNGPSSVSVSREYGHLYITDMNNRVIREVDLYDGIINTIAGTLGVMGFPGEGPAGSVSFVGPNLTALDEDFFAADFGSHSVGIIERDWDTGALNYFTIIGNGTAGFYGDGMDSMSALLNSPSGVIYAHPGNLYITDSGNGRIREINIRDSEPELIVTFKGAGSGFVNSAPGGDIGYCSTNDSFQRNFVGLDREIGLGVQYSYHDSQELLVFLRQGGSYASTDMDGQWNTRSIQIPAQGQTTGYNITYGVANIASGISNSGSYDSYGSFNSDSRAVFINTTTGQITVGSLQPGEKYDGALSAGKDRMVSAYIGNYTVFLEAMVRKDTGFVSSDMAGRWVMASIRVKMDGYADNFEVGTGELNIEPDGDYWGNWAGPQAYDIFNGIATIDSDGNMSFGSEPGVEDHFVMGADRRTIIGSSSNTTEHFLEFYVMTRMAEDYAYITNDLKGNWNMRNIITKVEGSTFGGDVSRCLISYADAGLLNGTCINPDDSIDGPFSFQSKVEVEGRWMLDVTQNNWNCESDPEWGTEVTLYATPDGGSTFTGWQSQNGECSGTGPCTFNIYNGTVITAMFDGGGGGLNIDTPSLPDGTLGSPYNQTLYASGGNTPYSWSIVNGSLPAGLALNNSTGQISGTPASAGYYAFTAQVQDYNALTAQRGLSINITTGGYIINSSSSLNGSISPTGSVNVSPGGSQSYTMSPASGYEVDYVMVDGVNIGAVTSYTFNNVNANHTIAVFFKSSTAIALPATGTLSSSQYGYNYGTSQHPTTLDVTFQYNGDGLERILHVRGYDIDTQGEVTVSFNGMMWASLNNTPDNAAGRDTLIWLPLDEMMMGTNTIRFTQNNSNETWGVTRLGVYNAGSTLGYVLGTTGGDTQHASGIDVWVPDMGMFNTTAWVLELAGWDSDSNTEIVVDLNGKKLGTLPSGPDNGLSPQYELYLPYDVLNPGDNYLTFRHFLGGAYNWGVKLNNLTDSGWVFGYMGTNSSTVDAARFLVPIEPSITRPMDVQFYDVSHATEVQVIINGTAAGYANTTSPSDWGSNQTYNIAPLSSSEWSLVRVEFDNTENPPSSSTWAVRPIEPLDTDNDGRADFSDWAPNDPAEWRDDDGDGIGDNADTDDDNDGMPDTWETANGFNPDNPADASSDADSDGLTNLGEYALGSNPYNSDTDSDTILDGADSGPNNASDTGPVINIPKGSYDASGYGWGFGTNQHQNVLVGKFTNEPYDKLLHIQSWDVDSSNEIQVRLNGVHMGYLSGQNNANGIGTVIVIPASMQAAGTNYVEISTIYNDGTWGVQRLGLFNYGMTFGNIQGGTGDRTHQDGMELLYKEQGTSNLIELSGWDSDTNTEIALTLNGSPIGALPIGPDNGWTQWYQLYLPKESGAGDVGRLRVNNSLSSAYNWGVKINSVKPGANQRSAAVGYMGGALTTTVDEATFLIPVPADIADYTRWLEVEPYDLDTNGELVFYLNGVAINYMLNPNSDYWGGSVATAIPPGQLSVLRIDNINNPAANDLWAVRIVDATDQDGDGHVDYMDTYPNYDVEWSNMDGDSLGDNSDSDRDGDLMDNNFESTNGFNPDDPADGLADSDSDGLSNSFEAYYGSNMASTDSDADTIPDGNDSHPNDASNTGAVVPIPSGSYASGGGAFGNAFGSSQHYSRLSGTFVSNGQSKLLYVRGLDIDTADEVEVRLNGKPLGYMTGVANTSGLDNIFLIPAEMQWSGTNRIEFIDNTPGEPWGIDRIGLFALGNTFGYIVGTTGDRDHMNGIDLHLYKYKANVVEIAGWDSDTDKEITLTLNGMYSIGALPAGPDVGWTPLYQLLVANEYLSGVNDYIRIKNQYAGAYNWGVKINAIRPSDGGIGYFGGAVTTTVDELTYLVPVSGDYGQMPLKLWFYDSGTGELSVYVNGIFNTSVPSDAQSGIWGSVIDVMLDPGKIAKVRVDNALNPPSTNIWGVSIQEPGNMDGDEAPDYRDPWPNDNTRWSDMDKDGIEDQNDPDVDGDGMPNSWEISNGFNLEDPYDGDGDTDADGLSNYFEYVYGTNLASSDSDGDTVLDGMDSSPALSNNTGAVVNAPMGSYTTTDYGWGYGTNQHYSVVTYVFNNPGVSKILMVKGYNSSNQSVLVRFNGEDIGYLTGIVSSLGKSNVWWLDKEKMRTGQNRIEFIRSGTGSWGISQLGVFNPGLTLGYIIGFTGGDRSHGEGVDLHVMGGKSSLIEMDLWDSDINGEIVMQSGGKEVGAMPAGVDNNWSQRYMYFWPSWYAAPGEDVVLSIMNFASPVYNWGIRLHGVHDAESGVGYLSEPAGSMADELTMLVPVAGDFGDMPFMLEFKETQGSELEIYVDGIYNGNSAFTQNLWGGQKTIMLSADFQHAIRFNNTFNPPTPDPWGVRIVPSTDTDGDTVPDYMDAWPNDPAEQFDTDSDGTGNNADTDDDNDGIPDTTEQAMGLDPWNPSDASVDNDSDWLNNYFEYLYGTTPGNPDSDGDTAMDGMDSAPMNPSYNGLVVNIPKGAYDTTTYGWGLGTNLHNGVVMGKFQSDGYDKVFMVKGWDIDALDEVTVKLNGEIIGYLTNSASDMGPTQANVWVLHNSKLRSGENRIEFVQKTDGETWGVSDLVLFNQGLTYGYILGTTGDRTHGEGIALHLPGNQSRFVELEGWDSDLDAEIEFQLAGWGETLYGLPIGPDNGWTPRYHLYLPKEYLDDSDGDNVLFIRNRLSPVYNWGIRFHGVTKALDGLGYPGPGPLTSTVDGAEILVPVMIDSGTMPLQLQFFDLQPGEVNVSVNGSYVGSPASDGGWGSPMDLNLPVNQMVKVSVDNTQNPPSTAFWGVRINDSADTDLDGVVDYLDPFPNDPTETEDHDNDGIGDNADTDDDNDLMPDSYEIGNGWDPFDLSNGMLDNDGDGLRRSYEYVFGTSDFNTDSDADGANDSVDGDPATWNATPPPVISLTTGVLNTGSFGWNYGTGVHEKRVIVKFNKDGYDKLLRVKGYDIDGYNNWPNYSSEVFVYLNGQLYGYMSPGLNNSVGAGEVFWLENEKLQPGENRVEFRQEIPVGEDWGVTSLSVINPGNTFGYIVGTPGDRTHGDGVNVHFQGDGPRARYLELAAWDSDSLTEIALNFNGVPMFYLPTIGDVTWSPWLQLYLPDEYMQAGDNVLFINNPAGSTYNWGVKLNALRDHIVTDGKESLGWMTGQISNTTVNDVTMLIPVFGAQRYIDLSYFDIGSNEVSVMIDGAPNGYLPSTPALQWGLQDNYLLLSPNKMHELKADNVSNPPGTEQWVVQIGGYHP